MQNKTKFLNINANEWFFRIFLRSMGLSLAHESSDISKCKQDIRLLSGNAWNLFPLACHFLFILQVHGIVNDTIDFVQDVITTEMNSATDNPVSFN